MKSINEEILDLNTQQEHSYAWITSDEQFYSFEILEKWISAQQSTIIMMESFLGLIYGNLWEMH